ncbi:MAG TPA: M48 family metalloprotease [Steroidobacteraceae bacterium]|nr:M48 family metalloprotease [Steroidobacteraceae bacterium]
MRRIFAATLGCLLTFTAGWAADVARIAPSAPSVAGDLPDLGGPSSAMVNRFDDSQIGRMEMNELRDQNLILDDAEVTDYLQQLGSRLSSQARADDQTFTYLALREPIVNAFATFGGFVCVNSGLILLTQDEAQLASVMAHETGHVVQHHMARAIQAQSRMSLASTAALLAAILIGAASGAGGQAIEGAVAMSQGIALQQSINFTRSQEIEADAVGIQLLAGAGFDPQEMATFFESLARVEGLAEGEIPALLQDHPVTSERIATSRARAAQMPRTVPQPESVSYPFIKERLRVLVTPPEGRLAQYYATVREHRPLTPAERYGEALLQMQNGEAASAVRTFTELQAKYPQLTMLYSALGQALASAGHPDAALAQFERSSRLFPRNVPLTVRYAETLMQAGLPQQAHEILLDLFNNVEPSPPQIRLTALAASAAGDPGDAYYYMAQYDLAGGNLPLANQQLELALAAPNLSPIQRARFRAQLDEVRGWLREQQAAHSSTSRR